MLLNENTTTKKFLVKRRSKDCDAEVISPERNDEDVELTVEDLLSIAEEYVSADKKQNEEHATTDKSSLSNPSSLIDYSKSCLGGALLSKCTSTSHDSHLIEKKEKEGESDKTEIFDSSFISTGDAAQDMLNLYFGPFLNCPSSIETGDCATVSENFVSVQAIESESSGQENIPKRMPSVSEFNRQVNSFGIPEEDVEAPLMKKKSSLKDKVSMFFN